MKLSHALMINMVALSLGVMAPAAALSCDDPLQSDAEGWVSEPAATNIGPEVSAAIKQGWHEGKIAYGTPAVLPGAEQRAKMPTGYNLPMTAIAGGLHKVAPGVDDKTINDAVVRLHRAASTMPRLNLRAEATPENLDAIKKAAREDMILRLAAQELNGELLKYSSKSGVDIKEPAATNPGEVGKDQLIRATLKLSSLKDAPGSDARKLLQANSNAISNKVEGLSRNMAAVLTDLPAAVLAPSK